MPPPEVRSIKDMIFWQYAKILVDIAGMSRHNSSIVKEKFAQLKAGKIAWPENLKDFIKRSEDSARCVYCGRKTILKHERLLPLSRGGAYDGDNSVMVCMNCSHSKGEKRMYEFYGLENRDTIPKIAEAKYLNLLYRLHQKRGTLDESEVRKMCVRCDMANLCPEKEILSVYCLEGCFTKT